MSPAWFDVAVCAASLDVLVSLGVDRIGAHNVGLANHCRAALDLLPSDSAFVSVATRTGPTTDLAVADITTALSPACTSACGCNCDNPAYHIRRKRLLKVRGTLKGQAVSNEPERERKGAFSLGTIAAVVGIVGGVLTMVVALMALDYAPLERARAELFLKHYYRAVVADPTNCCFERLSDDFKQRMEERVRERREDANISLITVDEPTDVSAGVTETVRDDEYPLFAQSYVEFFSKWDRIRINSVDRSNRGNYFFTAELSYDVGQRSVVESMDFDLRCPWWTGLADALPGGASFLECRFERINIHDSATPR